MTSYDFDRPFIGEKAMPLYAATGADIAARYGLKVRAIKLSNLEYKIRFDRLKRSINMKRPPSCGRIFGGYLVIRNLGSPHQYETWMPEDVFEDMYRAEPQTLLSNSPSLTP